MRVILTLVTLGIACGQQPDIGGNISRLQQKWAIAVPEFRGYNGAESVMAAFNATLRAELNDSGVLNLVSDSLYPQNTPQRPQDFRKPSPWLTDWSNPPVSATHLAFGYATVQDARLVLSGNFYNLAGSDPASASVFGHLYFGSLDNDGAKKIAHEFAAEILKFFNIKTLLGTKIYFVSDRTGKKQIWSMDFDGSNQKQLTDYPEITQAPAVSPNGKWLAYTTLMKEIPAYQIVLQSTDNPRFRPPFANPKAPTTGWPEFMPDGEHLLFASTATGVAQIYSSNLKGGERRQITNSKSIDLSPRVNPKTGAEVLFISDRSGKQQLWRMNIDGGDAEMLTDGTGEVANPSWSPDGQFIAFAWTRGFELGGFNIFVMRVSDRKIDQLTKDSGVNENPWWAPDGLHLVYTSRRGKTTQVFVMLADGTHVRALTTEGNNYQPVWANAIE